MTANDGYVVAEFKVNNSVIELESDTFLISGAMRDYNIEVSFIKANVIVDFEGDGASELENKSVAYGNTFGKLPIPDAILADKEELDITNLEAVKQFVNNNIKTSISYDFIDFIIDIKSKNSSSSVSR